jgi:hypothetical protein
MISDAASLHSTLVPAVQGAAILVLAIGLHPSARA